MTLLNNFSFLFFFSFLLLFLFVTISGFVVSFSEIQDRELQRGSFIYSFNEIYFFFYINVVIISHRDGNRDNEDTGTRSTRYLHKGSFILLEKSTKTIIKMMILFDCSTLPR